MSISSILLAVITISVVSWYALRLFGGKVMKGKLNLAFACRLCQPSSSFSETVMLMRSDEPAGADGAS